MRYVTITVLLLACHGKAQSSEDTDDLTAAWLKNKFPQVINNVNSDTAAQKTDTSKPAETSNKFDDEVGSSTPAAQSCKTEDGLPGVCVLYYQCDPSTRRVLRDGAQLIDVRIGESCPHYLDICCQFQDRIAPQEEDTTEQPALDMIPGGSTAVAALHKECGWNDPNQFVFQPPTQEVADGQSVYANYGEFPWMVALLRKSGKTVWVQNDYIGGGSLIHPSVVMTAYHKLLKVDAHELKCRAGEWDTQIEKEQYKIQERDADRFVAHPQFFKTSRYNDLALIFLKSPFDLTNAPHIGTACLSSVLPDKASCFSMGWGEQVQTEENVNILKKVKLPLIEHDRCETLLYTNTRFRFLPRFRLHESLTCARWEKNNTCQRDEGSSLVCPIGHSNGRTRYAVVGVVSYDLSCGKRKDVPGVYVNVPHLYDWVVEEMAAAGYNSSTFAF